MNILLTHMFDNTVLQQSVEATNLTIDKLIQEEFSGKSLSETEIVALGKFPESFVED